MAGLDRHAGPNYVGGVDPSQWYLRDDRPDISQCKTYLMPAALAQPTLDDRQRAPVAPTLHPCILRGRELVTELATPSFMT
jgi:hypothetical protein